MVRIPKKLKPCPFCARPKIGHHHFPGADHVCYCERCGVEVSGRTEAAAKRKWNHRPLNKKGGD